MNEPPSQIHATATCTGAVFAGEAEVGAYSVVMPGACVGKGVSIGSHCSVGAGAVLGDGVKIASMVSIEGGSVVGRGSTIEAHASIMGAGDATDITRGRSPVKIGAGCLIGANATVRPGVLIGDGAVVDAGAVVTMCVPPYSVVSGHPARVTGFVGLGSGGGAAPVNQGGGASVVPSSVRGVTVHRLPHIQDPRGSLTVGEFTRTVPFEAKRYFITFGVPNANVRGEHAHRRCHQFLVCVSGSCAVVVDDGTHREEIVLDRPTLGIHVPPMTWATEYKHSADSTLLVFASDFYDPEDYLRDYQEFVAALATAPRP